MKTHLISSEARIGKNVDVGHATVIHDHVEIKDNVRIGPYCVIGEPASGRWAGQDLVIGCESVIRSHAVMYEGSRFEGGIHCGHHVMIREGARAGMCLHLGSFCDVEGDCEFGDHVHCHGYVHVGRGSKIGNFVWLYSLVTLTNDPLPLSDIERPVTLEDGVVVCVGSTVLPGCRMRKGSMAAQGTAVQGEVPEGAIVSGPHGAVTGHVSALFDLESGTRHPWMRHAYHRYPKDQHARIQALGAEIVASRPRVKRS